MVARQLADEAHIGGDPEPLSLPTSPSQPRVSSVANRRSSTKTSSPDNARNQLDLPVALPDEHRACKSRCPWWRLTRWSATSSSHLRSAAI